MSTRFHLRFESGERKGELVPLLQSDDYAGRFLVERHVCIDTTAAGGNASLLAASSDEGAANG